jgi:hemolysin activation/secretion protein
VLLPFGVLAQNLPAEATPGGVLPGIENTFGLPTDAPTMSKPVLPKVEPQNFEAEEGETVVLSSISISGASPSGVNGIDIEVLQKTIDDRLLEKKLWSVNSLNKLAADVTNYYRSKDYLLTQAMVLEQSLADGQAEITIVQGVIGEVIPKGNENIRSKTIEKLFNGVKGKPSTRAQIESALFFASDLPGIRGRGVLQRGASQGTADMVYQVSDDDRLELYLNADNYGSEFVGEHRVRADIVVNNPLKKGDKLTFSGLKSFNPSNNDYLGFDYTIPTIMRGSGKPIYWGISGSKNEFKVGGDLASFGITGESTRLDAYMAYPYRRSFNDNKTWSLSLSSKASEVMQQQVRTSLDELTVLTLRHLWSRQYEQGGGGIFSLNATYSKGFDDSLGSMIVNSPESSRIGASGEKAGGDFGKYNLSFNLSHRLLEKLSLQVRLNSQQSDDLLVSLEQFPIGGPNSVRAYPLSSFLVDSGYFASAELRASPSERLQISLFADSAGGDLNEPLPADVSNVDVAGVGLGLSANLGGRYSLIATVARPVGSRPTSIKDETQFYLSLSANFK